ncbi:MAG: DUF1735 and LamG domain-containing protein [Bacteroidales bacterium]|nr:DUF1735 and LamG domain-containing protein [Bacteroidales bacterium]
MKTRNNRFLLLILLCGILAACSDDVKNFDNKLFLTSNTPVTTYVQTSVSDSQDFTGEFTLSIPKPQEKDVTFTVKADESLVSTYMASYYVDNVKAVPSDHYSLSATSGSIPAGALTSDAIEVHFTDMGSLDYDYTYVLPVTVVDASIDILGSARTTYFVFRAAALINKVANLKENNVYVEWVNPDVVQGMHTLTAEALIRPHGFTNQLNTLFGIEGQFLFRYGDAGLDPDLLQIATGNGNFALDTPAPLEEWLHVAVTYDYDAGTIQVYYNGKVVGDFTGVTYGPVNWGIQHSDESNGQDRCFWIGYSYDSNRWFDADFSEVRIWNRVLTSEEINSENHFYAVDTDSDGLVVYWKFNDEADIIRDYTENGNNATASYPLTWVDVELPAAN